MSKFCGKKESKVTDSKLCYYLQSFKLKKLLIDNISRNCVVEIVVPQTDYKESNENLDSETNKILDAIPEE
ncbi:MAG: hypothetical protein MHPSP_003199, partial [Paramarteilia canceri]